MLLDAGLSWQQSLRKTGNAAWLPRSRCSPKVGGEPSPHQFASSPGIRGHRSRVQGVGMKAEELTHSQLLDGAAAAEHAVRQHCALQPCSTDGLWSRLRAGFQSGRHATAECKEGGVLAPGRRRTAGPAIRQLTPQHPSAAAPHGTARPRCQKPMTRCRTPAPISAMLSTFRREETSRHRPVSPSSRPSAVRGGCRPVTPEMSRIWRYCSVLSAWKTSVAGPCAVRKPKTQDRVCSAGCCGVLIAEVGKRGVCCVQNPHHSEGVGNRVLRLTGVDS